MLYYIIIVLLSLFIGFMLARWYGEKRKFFGEIIVQEKGGVTLYSLELNGAPEKIKDEKEVTFKVVIPAVESDRE